MYNIKTLVEDMKSLDEKLPEKAVIYGEQGFWYDSIASVAEVYSSEPNNRELANIWSNLLDSDFVQLEEIVNQPIVN